LPGIAAHPCSAVYNPRHRCTHRVAQALAVRFTRARQRIRARLF